MSGARVTSPMLPVRSLRIGTEITPRIPIGPDKVRRWKYGTECPPSFPVLTPGTPLEVFEITTSAAQPWVKVHLPHTHNTMYLKIAGEELSWNFLLLQCAPVAFDVDRAARYIAAHAESGSLGRCAAYVRAALQEGGLDMRGHPVSARDYGAFLVKRGFAQLPGAGYQPVKGDIVVIQNYAGGDPHGHIAMYDGAGWVSDFKQRDMWGGPGYRKYQPPHTIYRMP